MNATTITETATETQDHGIAIKIDDGPVTPDFDGRGRGWQASLWLDPEAREVTVHTSIGSGTPMHAWHSRSLMLSLPASAAGEAVREIVEEHIDAIAEAFDSYGGTHWDGHNNVGSWEATEEGFALHEGLLRGLEEALADVACYASAGDWLGQAWSESKREVERVLDGVEGEDEREVALAKLAASWTEQGESDGVLVDEDDVRKQIDAMAEELAKEASEDDSDDE